MTAVGSGLAATPPGRFRLVELATGERLDLSDPTLGRPDGLELWDRATEQVSHRHAPVARCLFPLCVGAGLVLKTYRATGTRYAQHFSGEGSGIRHSVAAPDDPQHDPAADVWQAVLDRAGHPTARREGAVGPRGGQIRADVLVLDAPQPVSIEVQLTQNKTHLARTRRAATLGVVAVWHAGPGVNLRDRVPQLRCTTDIADLIAARSPQDLRFLGVRHLTPVRDVAAREWRIRPSPAPMRMGDIAEQLPAGALVPVGYGKAQLLVPAAMAATYASSLPGAADDAERPALVPLGELHRHAALARDAGLDPDEPQGPFAAGPGSLVGCVVCGTGTFRRRWGFAICPDPDCEAALW